MNLLADINGYYLGLSLQTFHEIYCQAFEDLHVETDKILMETLEISTFDQDLILEIAWGELFTL